MNTEHGELNTGSEGDPGPRGRRGPCGDMMARSTHYDAVREFMNTAQQNCPCSPTEPTEKERLLRARLILEEAFELIQRGLGVDIYVNETWELDFEMLEFTIGKEYNPVETADGCADLSVVNTGTLICCGIPDIQLLHLVDENNLDKFLPGYYIDKGGKLNKPPGHKPPDIAGLLKMMEGHKMPPAMTFGK